MLTVIMVFWREVGPQTNKDEEENDRPENLNQQKYLVRES